MDTNLLFYPLIRLVSVNEEDTKRARESKSQAHRGLSGWKFGGQSEKGKVFHKFFRPLVTVTYGPRVHC